MHRNMLPGRAWSGRSVRGLSSRSRPCPRGHSSSQRKEKTHPPPQRINKDPAFSDGISRAGLRMGGESEACRGACLDAGVGVEVWDFWVLWSG